MFVQDVSLITERSRMNSEIEIGDILEYRFFDVEAKVHALFYVCSLKKDYICGTYVRHSIPATMYRNKMSVQHNIIWSIGGIKSLMQSGNVILYKRKK